MNIANLFHIMKMQIFVDLVCTFFNFDPVCGGGGGISKSRMAGEKSHRRERKIIFR